MTIRRTFIGRAFLDAATGLVGVIANVHTDRVICTLPGRRAFHVGHHRFRRQGRELVCDVQSTPPSRRKKAKPKPAKLEPVVKKPRVQKGMQAALVELGIDRAEFDRRLRMAGMTVREFLSSEDAA